MRKMVKKKMNISNNDVPIEHIWKRMCIKCGSIHPETHEHFYRNKSNVWGFSVYCKKCENKLMKERRDRKKLKPKKP